jgi:hypothetical protein
VNNHGGCTCILLRPQQCRYVRNDDDDDENKPVWPTWDVGVYSYMV